MFESREDKLCFPSTRGPMTIYRCKSAHSYTQGQHMPCKALEVASSNAFIHQELHRYTLELEQRVFSSIHCKKRKKVTDIKI